MACNHLNECWISIYKSYNDLLSSWVSVYNISCDPLSFFIIWSVWCLFSIFVTIFSVFAWKQLRRLKILQKAKNKKGHDDYRSICCFFCLRKGESKSDRLLSSTEKNLITENWFKNFVNSKDFLPGGICGSCRINLSRHFGKNPSHQNYKAFPCESDEQYYPKNYWYS